MDGPSDSGFPNSCSSDSACLKSCCSEVIYSKVVCLDVVGLVSLSSLSSTLTGGGGEGFLGL